MSDEEKIENATPEAEEKEVKHEPVSEEKKSKITEIDVVVPEEKRDRIVKLNLPGVKTTVIDKEGKLSVIHDEETEIDADQIRKAVESFDPQPTELERIKALPDKSITLENLIYVLRQNGTL